jgi:hypothetical protein
MQQHTRFTAHRFEFADMNALHGQVVPAVTQSMDVRPALLKGFMFTTDSRWSVS